MKIIELTETQFKNYSTMHSSRNYFQTVEYANTNLRESLGHNSLEVLVGIILGSLLVVILN